MADAVVVTTLLETKSQLVVHLTNVSDGTGEAAVKKVDKSTFLAPDGAEPAVLNIERVDFNIQGFSNIKLLYDHTTDDLACVLCGVGSRDFLGKEQIMDVVGTPGITDPKSAGGTGDIMLTAPAGATTGTYDITLWLRKMND